MNCKKARLSIITDYIDNESKGHKKAAIEAHLAGCRSCREFLTEAQKVGGEFFLKAGRAEPPEYLWQKIREAVLTEGKNRNWASGIFRRAGAFLYIPHPAFAIASVIMILFILGTAARMNIVRTEERLLYAGQAQYFDYIAETPAFDAANESAGFGTAIEKYFL